jgi:hypothetical protein
MSVEEVEPKELSPFGTRVFSAGLGLISLGWSVFFFREFGWSAIAIWNLVPGFVLGPFYFWRASQVDPTEGSIRWWRASFYWHLLQFVSILSAVPSCGMIPFGGLARVGLKVEIGKEGLTPVVGFLMLTTLMVACLGSLAALVSDRQWHALIRRGMKVESY